MTAPVLNFPANADTAGSAIIVGTLGTPMLDHAERAIYVEAAIAALEAAIGYTATGLIQAPIIEKCESANQSGGFTIPDVPFYTMHYYNLIGSVTPTFPTLGAGKSFSIEWQQASAGGYGITWPSTRWAGIGGVGSAPSIPTVLGSVFITSHACYNGTNWESVYIGQVQ